MNTIKTWEERITSCGRVSGGHGGGEPCGLSNIFCSECRNKAKDAEIEEYRALAASATPAQPVPVQQRETAWEYSFTHSSAVGHGDTTVGPCLTYDKAIAFGVGCFGQREVFIGSRPSPASDVSAPSPSSVGAAIRALPLPEPAVTTDMHIDGKGRPAYTPDQVRALLSEAAALAEQVQGQKIAQDGRDALLLEAADFLWSAARMEQSSHDSPPEPFSEWDNDALVLSNKLRSGVKDVSLTEDALRYRHLRNLMRFSSSKLEAPTMTLSAPLDAPEHDPHTDWMAERFDESVDRTVDASIAAHNNVRETEASNGNG